MEFDTSILIGNVFYHFSFLSTPGSCLFCFPMHPSHPRVLYPHCPLLHSHLLLTGSFFSFICILFVLLNPTSVFFLQATVYSPPCLTTFACGTEVLASPLYLPLHPGFPCIQTFSCSRKSSNRI